MKANTTDKSQLKASFYVALNIVKCKKAFTVAENLIKPCLIEVATEILGSHAADKLKMIPLPDNTIQRRIVEMAADVEEHVIEGIKNSPYFAIQLNESADTSNYAIYFCFVRYEDEGDIKEELLSVLDLPGCTNSSEIFGALSVYFEEHNLDLRKCVGACTDGAASMRRLHSGTVAKLKQVAPPDMLFPH